MKTNKEIEIKWHADHVKRSDFLEFMMGQLKKTGTTKWGYVTVFGPDYYWETDQSWVGEATKKIQSYLETVDLPQDKKNEIVKTIKDSIESRLPLNVIRNRVSEDRNELTAKARLGDRHITVRQEENVLLDKQKAKQKDIDNLISLIGMKRSVTIKKDCDIYNIEMDNGAKVDVVWYKTMVKGFDDQVFIEVEVEGIPENEALEVLTQWKNQLRYHLKLTDDLISNESLYEIFTGKTYKKV